MTIYVAHSPYDQKARKCLDVVTDLQNRFPEHTFVCNVLAFWHLYADTPGEKLYNIETDLLMVCDKMYLTTQPIGILRKEVEYARKIGMEVVDLATEYRAV